jgi:hypothetical protein
MKRELALLVGFVVAACSGADSDPGLRGGLRVLGAQYVRGALPPAGEGPAIVSLRVPHAQVLPGQRRELLTGSITANSEAVLIGQRGDPGYWIVTAGAPAIEEPELPTFRAELSFARDLSPGPLTLELCAVRVDGAIGAYRSVSLDAAARLRSDSLSVELRWDTQADLDLHVLMPDGRELSPDNINSYEAPAPGAAAPDPTAYQRGATLDLDSNGNCWLDGRREERASWPAPPASGSYVVRVATASLCEESVAHWTIEVWLAGQRVQRVEGTSQGFDTRAGAGVGAGVLATEFSVP